MSDGSSDSAYSSLKKSVTEKIDDHASEMFRPEKDISTMDGF